MSVGGGGGGKPTYKPGSDLSVWFDRFDLNSNIKTNSTQLLIDQQKIRRKIKNEHKWNKTNNHSRYCDNISRDVYFIVWTVLRSIIVIKLRFFPGEIILQKRKNMSWYTNPNHFMSNTISTSFERIFVRFSG